MEIKVNSGHRSVIERDRYNHIQTGNRIEPICPIDTKFELNSYNRNLNILRNVDSDRRSNPKGVKFIDLLARLINIE